MYEKMLYKVPSQNNKVLYRVQDLTRNDKVNEDMFEEGQNTKGAKRLQCPVFVLHVNEFEELKNKETSLNNHIDVLTDKLMQRDKEIKKLKSEIEKLKSGNAEADKQLNANKFNMLQEYTDKVSEIEKAHQDELDKLKETHKDELDNIHEEHTKKIKELRSQYTAKLDKANEDLNNEVKANNKDLDNLRAEMLTMKDEHNVEVTNLQNKHHKAVETIQHEHSAELQALRKTLEHDIGQLKQNIADSETDHLKEIKEMELSHTNEVNDIRAELTEAHNKEVNDIRAKCLKAMTIEHTKDMADLQECEDVPFYVKPFLKSHLKALDTFKKRKTSNTPQSIIKTYELEESHNE